MDKGHLLTQWSSNMSQAPLWHSPPNAWQPGWCLVVFKLPGFFQWALPMSPHHLTPKHLRNTFRLCELSWEFLQHQRCRCSAKLRRPGHRAVQRGHYPTLRAFFRRPKIPQTRQPCPVEVQWGIQRNLPVDTGYGCLNEDEDKMRCNMVQHVSCFPFIGGKIGCTPSNYTKNMSWLTLQNIWHHLALWDVSANNMQHGEMGTKAATADCQFFLWPSALAYHPSKNPNIQWKIGSKKKVLWISRHFSGIDLKQNWGWTVQQFLKHAAQNFRHRSSDILHPASRFNHTICAWQQRTGVFGWRMNPKTRQEKPWGEVNNIAMCNVPTCNEISSFDLNRSSWPCKWIPKS